MPNPFLLKTLELGPMQNCVYLLGDPASREAAVVDPGWEAAAILETVKAEGLRLTTALVTHQHFDHVMALAELLAAMDLAVYVHEADAGPLKLAPQHLRATADGDRIPVGSLSVEVLHTPGHTPGSQCFLIGGHVFTGDTLFIQACGRWDLPGGNAGTLFESLTRLAALDEATIVCPGHHYAPALTSTIGEERRANPFLQPRTREEFLRFVG